MRAPANLRRRPVGDDKNWWTTLPGVLTALATLITAITGLYLALARKPDPCKDLPFDRRPVSCLGDERK